MTFRQRLPQFLAGVLAASLLAACAAPATPGAVPAVTAAPASSQPTAIPAPTIQDQADDLTRTDAQGSVEFAVAPLNLKAPGATLDFTVRMNTHSVNLDWNLAAQSTLKTDTGLEVNGANWPAGSGHHFEGTLSFPSQTADGKALLAGAKSLTLTIRDTDVPERVFVWPLGQ